MFFLVFESWLLLAYFEYLMRSRGFAGLHRAVCQQQASPRSRRGTTESTLTKAVELACVLYFKEILCLQHSAAITVLYRRHGFDAQMVIGAKLFPFESHAWVEVEKKVVNDKPDFTGLFEVMERC